MKKLLSCLLLCTLAACSAYASTDTPVASVEVIGNKNILEVILDGTDDELLWIKKVVVGELFSRHLQAKTPIYQGEYIVGVDLPSGTFTIEISSKSIMAYVDVTPKDCEDEFLDTATYAVMQDNDIGKIEFKDGDTVTITGGTVMLSEYSGVFFPY